MKTSDYHEGKDFSIVLGGPFFQLLRKIGLSGSALELLSKRAIIISLLAWLPLLILSVIKGQAWGNETNLPFIEDFEVHIRFLVAMPLMIFAELIVHERMRMMVKQFEERNLIPDDALERFRNAMADIEWLFVNDDVEERFANRFRMRVGGGYRVHYGLRVEFLYMLQQSRNTIEEDFVSSDNIFRIRVKHYLRMDKPSRATGTGN